MKNFFSILAMPALAFTLLATPAYAGEQLTTAQALELIKPFYDFFGRKSSRDEASMAFSPDWKSYYSNSGYKTLDQTMGFLGGPLQKMVPDLNWEIKSVSITNNNEIVVRGEGTGTPVGENFFGQPVTGKSFKLMSIDVHKVENGKIVKTHHIEDWNGALRQLAKEPN